MTKNNVSFIHKMTIMSLILGLLVNSSFTLLHVVSVKADPNIKIMPLGDSITRGTVPANDPVGYRQKLYLDLTNAGFNIDFVGQQSDGSSSEPAFDTEHEGHPAYQADQIRDNVYAWITSNPADIVLLHIGTNDISNGENVTGIVTEVEEILDEISRYETNAARNVTVILARIVLRTDDSALNEMTKDFNVAVANMAQARISSGDDIIVVDMETALIYPDDMEVNGKHPNAAGYEKMASVWYNAVYADLITHKPIAKFTGSPLSGSEPLNVSFSDASTSSDGIVSWEWDFGDGATSADQDSTHVYAEGTYTVSLTVTESDGDSDVEIKMDYITVTAANQPPVANAGGPYSGTEGTAISFVGSGSNDSDGSIVSWDWNFGDGNTSTLQNPTHIYNQEGTYSVTLTVTDDDSATDVNVTSAVVADADPQAIFTGFPLSGSEPLNVSFSDASTSSDGIVSWEWDFGDGNSSTLQNPSHVYANEGTYPVSLTVTESDGDSDTETKPDYITVTASLPPPPPPNNSPVAGFEIQSSTKPAINEEISFIDKSSDKDGTIASWSWSFGDGNTSTTQNATHRYQSAGTYTVTLTIKDDDGATGTKTKQITIYDINPPVTTDNYNGLWHNSDLTITLTATDDFSGVAETYYKINGGSTIQLITNGQPQITEEGINRLEYWSIDKAGNEETHHILDVKLDKTSPTADAGQDITVTEDTIIHFNGSNSTDNIAISRYTWILFDGTLQTLDGVNSQYIFHTPGVYTANLTVSDAALNSAVDTITVTVIDITNPVANAGDDQVVHQGESVTFDGSASTDNVGIVSYSWDFVDVDPQHLVGVNPPHSFQSAGIHKITLTVSDEQGNSATDVVAVTVIDSTWPAVNAGPDQIVEEDEWVYFNGSGSSDNVGIISYVWTFTDGTLQTLYGVNASYVFETPGIYVVTLTVSDAEGHSSNDTVTIFVQDVTAPTIEVEDYVAVSENSPVNFDASSSYDNADIVNYHWVFGDGTAENTTVPKVIHIYTQSGVYNVELTVTDTTGNVNGTFISIVVHRDTDGDGIPDYLDADDDGDGIPDDWELHYDLDPLDSSDASGDSDGDGVSNLEEYRNDSDPKGYDFSTFTLSIVLVVAVILSMISFGIFYSRKVQERIK